MTRKILNALIYGAAFFAAMVLTLAAQASEPSDCGPLAMPPAMYDNIPLPTNTFYRPLPWYQLQQICFEYGGIQGGCTQTEILQGVKFKIIHYPLLGADGFTDKNLQACIIYHEEAHAKGWPGDHPEARRL